MKTEIFNFTGHNGTNLPAVIWQPDGEVKAVLQVAHGMTEHMGRYEHFAAALCSQGVAVAGFDLRGHGKNDGNSDVASCGAGGWDASIEDMYLFFGTYNQKFKPNRTTADWLCSDEAALDRYLADPLVRKDISSGLFCELLGSMKRTGKNCAYGSMPILLISGQHDPVGDCGKGVRAIYNRMKKMGMESITLRLFDDARHDIFHEEANGAAEAVRHCICDWLLQ